MIKINKKVVAVFVILSVFSIAGCEKIIDLKTDKLQDKYVIEANLSDQAGDCQVTITKAISLNDPNIFYGVSNATVTISDGTKPPVKLNETVPGLYLSDNLSAISGHTYNLKVETVDGKTFTSACTVPEKVLFDTMFVADFSILGSNRKFANIIFQDPPGKGNNYRFLQFKNEVQNSNIFILNDEYSDGRTINTFLAFFDESDDQRIDVGDTILVEMQCISPAIYGFFNSLNQSSTGGAEVVAPGNPVTNIEGGATGYFNAYIKQQRSVIVTE